MSRAHCVVLAVLLLSGCATTGVSSRQEAARRIEAVAPAVKALQEARFEDALRESSATLQQDDGNATAHAVWAVAEFRQTLHEFYTEALTLTMGAVGSSFLRSGALSPRLVDFMLTETDRRLEVIDGHLAKAALDADFSLDLCLACWEVDWNHSGKVDERDWRLLQVEYDAQGKEFPQDDPRRTPTFHFDAADISWLRAMIHFQRALLNGVLAYDLSSALENIFERGGPSRPIVIKLRDKERVHRARDLILEGLKYSRLTRAQVLAETDDLNEWLPNPRQKSRPLPLSVDDSLFQTWEGVLSDMDGLLHSRQGLSVEALAQLGDHRWNYPPQGFIDVGALLLEPGDIVLNLEQIDNIRGGPDADPAPVEAILRDTLGKKYRPSMTPTPLLQRLSRIKGEIDRGEEGFERKLRYLLWLN